MYKAKTLNLVPINNSDLKVYWCQLTWLSRNSSSLKNNLSNNLSWIKGAMEDFKECNSCCKWTRKPRADGDSSNKFGSVITGRLCHLNKQTIARVP